MYFCNEDGTFIAAQYDDDVRHLPEIIKTKVVAATWGSYVTVKTSRSQKDAFVGDWIVADGHGNCEVYTDDVFKSSFIPVETLNGINNGFV